MQRWGLFGIYVLLCSMAHPSVVHALDDTSKARKHFEKGKNLYDAGDFAPALVEFKEAFRLRDDAAFLFNMGQCHSKLGDDSAALHAYKSFLRRKPEAPNRAQVEARIAEIEERQKQPAVAPLVPPPDSPPLLPNLQPVATTPSPALDLQSTQPISEPAPTPVLKSWWFWTGVGVVIVGGVTTALLLSRGTAKNGCDGESLVCVKL
jgi:tetratricopeptide (TPR) repeat protein